MGRTCLLILIPMVLSALAGCAGNSTCQTSPHPIAGPIEQFSGYRAREISFGSGCERLAGTLFLPEGEGPFPAVVFVHGASPPFRLHYGGGFLELLVETGIAVYTYDRRGSGESEGSCCPGGSDRFELLAQDASAAVSILLDTSEIDPTRNGFLGVSQAGWVIPIAIAETPETSFAVLLSGPAVSVGIANQFDELTDQGVGRAEALRRSRTTGSSGFDHSSYLAELRTPTLWLYGEFDEDQPTEMSVEALASFNDPKIDVRVFSGVGHDLVPHPELISTIASWIHDR